MNPLPGVHLVFGRLGQFEFHHQDRQVVDAAGELRTACRFCGQAVQGRFRFYCSQACGRRFWDEVVPPRWDDIRRRALARDGHRCTRCGAKGLGARLEVDHIKPVAIWPELELDLANVRTLCHACHAAVGARPTPMAARLARAGRRASQASLDASWRPSSDRPAAPEAPQGPTPPATFPLTTQGARKGAEPL